MNSGRIHIGIGGWSFAPWQGSFYPKGLPARRELEHASRKLTSIEVNGTYYRAQTPETFQKWHDETPDDFVFAVKAPRYATNRKVLAGAGDSIARFLDGGLMRLGDKLGPINWQFMATRKFDPDDFAAFLALLPDRHQGRPLRHAVEVRHDTFRDPAFTAMIRDRGIAAVVSADGGYTQIADPTAPFVYARIMGTTDGAATGYDDAGLDLWAARIREWAAGGCPDGLDHVDAPAPGQPRDVYLYVIGGHKAANPQAAMGLIERLA